jgi:hypothetical protein
MDTNTTNRKFFKTTYTIEVLSEHEPASNLSLTAVDHAITYGDCEGKVTDDGGTELTFNEMVIALYEQGSSVEFFNLKRENPKAGPSND